MRRRRSRHLDHGPQAAPRATSRGPTRFRYRRRLGGPAPQIGLGYSSGSVDGRMASTNNQTSWVGEGWDYWPGFIERRYKPCVDDMADGNNTVKTGDLCWARQNLTMSLNGRSTELVLDDATDQWRPATDDGSRIQRFTGAVNGDKDGEYWVVTTTDGTQYFFGRHRIAAAQSVWTVPVFGNQPGEPCHAVTFAASSCDQAWRWNLDYVVDPHSNSMSLFYAKEINHYGRNIQTKATPYVRGGYLTRIDYGQRAGGETLSAPARVIFGVAERCIPVAAPAPNPFDCAAAKFTKANAARWPDTPVEQNCNATEACTDRFSPTFWSRKRLTTVATEVLVGNTGSTYRPVDTWSLTHEFLRPERPARRRCG